MKQTNSAISMLLNAFKSIYKRAYIKGVASAVVLTAGLSAGVAQAAEVTWTNGTGDIEIASGTDNTISIADDTKDEAVNLSVSEGAALTISGNVSGANTNFTLTGNAQIYGALTLSGAYIQGYAGGKDSTGTLTVSGENSALTLDKSHVEILNTRITNGAEVTIGGSFDSGESTGWRGNSNLIAGWEDNGSADFTALTIDGGATVNLNDDSIIGVAFNGSNADVAHNANVGNATINFAGDDRLGALFLGMTSNDGTLGANNTVSFNDGAKLNVSTDGKYGAVFAPTVNFNAGSVLTVASGATFEVAGSLKNDKSNNDGVVNFAGTFSNAGTLNIGNNSGGDITFTAVGGSIDNDGTLNVYGTADFGSVLDNDGTFNVVKGTSTVNNLDALGLTAEKATAKINVSNGAELSITEAAAITESDLFSSAEAAGKIHAEAGSTLRFADLTVNSTDSKDGNSLSINGATLRADNLSFQQRNTAAEDAAPVYEDITLSSGTFFVYDSLSGEGGKLIVDDAQDTALHLGNAQSSGSINNISEIVYKSGADFIQGSWDANGTDITVSGSAQLMFNGDFTEGGTLTVNGTRVNVATDHSVIFERLNAVSGNINIGGTLTITGDEQQDTVDGATTHDVTIAGTVSGVHVDTNGTLSLGADAADDILSVADDGKVSVISSGDVWDESKVSVAAGGTLQLSLGSNAKIEASDVAALTAGLVSSNNGIIDFGNATFTVEDDDGDGIVAWDDVSGYAGVQATNSTMKNLAVQVDDGDVANGSIGALITTETGDNAAVAVTKTTILNKAYNGKFASSTDGSTADIEIQGSIAALTLNGSGEAGDITATASDPGRSVTLTTQGGNISLGDVSVDTFNVNSATTATDVTVDALNLSSNLTVRSADEDTDYTVSTGTISGEGSLSADVLTLVAGGANHDYGTAAGTIEADSIIVDGSNGSGSLTVTGALFADSIIANDNSFDLSLGNAEDNGVGEVNSLNLSGGSLIVDPSYDTNASVFAIKGLDSEGDLGADINISGSTLVGQNSILGVGTDLASLYAAMSGYLTNGALNEDSVGAVLYLNTAYTVAANENLYIDSTKTGSEIETAVSSSQNTFTLGENSAVIISSDFAETLLEKQSAYAINLAGGIASADAVTFAEGSKIIVNKGFVSGQSIGFLASGGAGYDLTEASNADSANVEITAAGGLVLGSFDDHGRIVFSYDKERGESLLTNVSSPVKGFMSDIFAGELTGDGLGYSYIVDTGANGGGKSVETTARLATYAGAIQATYMAQQASTEAVADRLGMANPNSALISSDNRQGGGLWLMPVYKNHDSDSFDAQGVDYGADIDLYGVALGADVTTDSGVRVGAYFNVGSGEADGQGVADEVSNDFDYYGMGLYAGVTFGQFALIADAGFTQVSNNIDQNAYLGKLTADTDTQAVTVGVRGEYKFATSYVDVVPHLGLRYTNLDMDSYDVKSNGGVVASTDADNMTVFSIPVGVTFSKDIIAGDWSVKPVFDLTLTANTGDDELDTNTSFSGVDRTLALSTEVMDDFTYGGTLGIDAQYRDSLSFGVNVSYVGSDNADEFGVVGNIRYMF